jgi:hypothetical protein
MMGARSFAHFAKGGHPTAKSELFWLEGLKRAGIEPIPSAASYPPLHKRKDGAPAVLETGKKNGP